MDKSKKKKCDHDYFEITGARKWIHDKNYITVFMCRKCHKLFNADFIYKTGWEKMTKQDRISQRGSV